HGNDLARIGIDDDAVAAPVIEDLVVARLGDEKDTIVLHRMAPLRGAVARRHRRNRRRSDQSRGERGEKKNGADHVAKVLRSFPAALPIWRIEFLRYATGYWHIGSNMNRA